MTKELKHFLTLHNKKYFYTIKPLNKKSSFLVCEGANIAQEFLNEDIPQLLNDLPSLILAEKEYVEKQSEIIRFRVTTEDKKRIEKSALDNGYDSISSYLRHLALKLSES